MLKHKKNRRPQPQIDKNAQATLNPGSFAKGRPVTEIQGKRQRPHPGRGTAVQVAKAIKEEGFQGQGVGSTHIVEKKRPSGSPRGAGSLSEKLKGISAKSQSCMNGAESSLKDCNL